MDEKINLEKVIELLYQERPLDQQELSVIGKFLKSPANLEQLNSYLDEIPEAGSSGIKLKVGTIWERSKNAESLHPRSGKPFHLSGNTRQFFFYRYSCTRHG
jgi:hypothetical protein